MNKKYIVRLSDEERGVCQDIVKRLKGTSEKVKRGKIGVSSFFYGKIGENRCQFFFLRENRVRENRCQFFFLLLFLID